jgi:lysozyme family protein
MFQLSLAATSHLNQNIEGHMTLNRSAMVADYQSKYDTMVVARTAAVEAEAKLIVAGWDRYKRVEQLTGIPAVFIGVLHSREADCNFNGCLANGDPISRRTRHDPAGFGPWPTWEESAVWALKHEGFSGTDPWSIGDMLFDGETFNGEGYHLHGFENPYLWGGTQFYHKGKYTSDGHYSFNFVDPQVGIAPVIKRVLELTHATVPAKPLVIAAMANGKLHPADKRAVFQNSRALRYGEWYTNFCHYLGLTWATALATVQQLQPFLTDWRTLTVLGVLGGGYLMHMAIRFNLLQMVAQGRMVPSGLFNVGQPAMADGPAPVANAEAV